MRIVVDCSCCFLETSTHLQPGDKTENRFVVVKSGEREDKTLGEIVNSQLVFASC
jgi:hypothetical protein